MLKQLTEKVLPNTIKTDVSIRPSKCKDVQTRQYNLRLQNLQGTKSKGRGKFKGLLNSITSVQQK